MSGECKSYRLNDPMTWAEFKSMPDDLKVVYIQALRKKYNVPDKNVAEMFGINKDYIYRQFKALGLGRDVRTSHPKWDKEGFYAWVNGVPKIHTPVIEEPAEAPVFEVTQEDISDIEQEMPGVKILPIEPEAYVEEDLPFEELNPFRGENPVALHAEIDALKLRIDELLKINEELMAVHEKDRAENAWLRNECESNRMDARILEAQMDVVRLIFGGKNNG